MPYPHKPGPIEDKITPPMVCRSAAGYYIGTKYWDDECQAWLPYSRESEEYWLNASDAQKALELDSYILKLEP